MGTSKEAAKFIISEGEILPSLGDNGDAIHGDGVYLTTLEPGLGEETIKNNNWDGVAATKNIEVFFEIQMPSSNVVRAKDTRDIQIHKGPLLLCDYKWNLKNWDGKLLATQFFMVSSEGKAKEHQGRCLGRYTIIRNIVMRQGDSSIFLYKQDEGDLYLYNSEGDWAVGAVAGEFDCALCQYNGSDRIHYSPSKITPWKYYSNGWHDDDETLKVFPCYF